MSFMWRLHRTSVHISDMSVHVRNNAAPVFKAASPFRNFAQVRDVQVTTEQAVYARYQKRLEQKAKEQGKSLDELKSAVTAPSPPTPLQASSRAPFEPPPPPEPQREQQTPPPQTAAPQVPSNKSPVKTLSGFIDVEKTSALPDKEVETIWRLRHVTDPQSLCAVMQAETFRRMIATAKKHPQFILPLPRQDQGAEIHFLQWTFPSPTTATVLFTHLAEFKVRGEYAQPHTTVTHHLDLADSNELVLLEGRVQENRGISVDEGKWLLMCLQKFYGFEAHSVPAKESLERRRKLMEQFSGGDEGFKVEELLEEAEKVP